MAHENYAKCEFVVYASSDATADAASCSNLVAFILTPKESKSKTWTHIKHCFKVACTSAPIFETIMKRYPIFSVQIINYQIDQMHK